MELCIGGLVHFKGNVSDDSCKAKASGNCFQFLFIVDRLEFPVCIDELKPGGILKKKFCLYVCAVILQDEVGEGLMIEASSMANRSVATPDADTGCNDIQRQVPPAPMVNLL